ncbi:MAG: amino acid permease, partial [Nitrososphaerales archaeon]
TMGYAWHNAGLVSFATSFTSTTNFEFAVLLLILGALITTFGPKFYSRVMIALAAIIFLGTFIFIGIAATTSTGIFQNAFNSYAQSNGLNATYQGIINSAGSAGWTFQPVTTALTLASIPFGVLLFNGFNYSVYVSGETKDVRRSMLWGVLLALLICGILDIIGLYFGVNMIGYKFNQAAFYLFGHGSSAWPFPGISPWISLFTPMLITNPYLATFVQLGWVLFFVWWAGALILAISRYVFAFSFDRVIPTFFADVNQRFHFPLKATVLVLLIGLAFLVDFNFYNTYLLATLNTTAIWAVVWVVVGLSAIVFAIKKKEMVRSLPGGPALLIVFGLLSMIAMSITFYYAATNAAIGPFTSAAQGLLGVVFGSGLVIYIISYYYHKSKNINLDLVLKEIPPE